jgi:hypothetical protein
MSPFSFLDSLQGSNRGKRLFPFAFAVIDLIGSVDVCLCGEH